MMMFRLFAMLMMRVVSRERYGMPLMIALFC